MSFAGRAVNSNGCVTKPKGREIGLQSCFVQIRSSSLTGSYVMETAEQREPDESRGSRTVLGEPGGESPPGHSTIRGAGLEAVDAPVRCQIRLRLMRCPPAFWSVSWFDPRAVSSSRPAVA